MFEEDKNPVIEEVTENVEETTEETAVEPSIEKPTEPVESEEERINRLVNEKVNELLPKKMARKEAKIRKEYINKYGKLENVLRAGTGETDLDKITDTFSDFYIQKGIQMPTEPTYSDRDMEVLANAEAEDIINSGFDEVVEEVDRLAAIGVDNMSARDKLLFTQLASYRQREENRKSLTSIGVKGEVLDSKEFKDFAEQFNSNIPVTKIYDLYKKTLPKEVVEPIGSMKNTTTNEVKDYYTPEEARRLTEKQLDDPAVMAAVEKSMARWYKEGIM